MGSVLDNETFQFLKRGKERRSYQNQEPTPLQRGEKPPPVFVISENRLSPVAAIHHMIDRPGILDSELARHAPRLPRSAVICQYQELTRLCLHKHRDWSALPTP